jgi:hypothetical protein
MRDLLTELSCLLLMRALWAPWREYSGSPFDMYAQCHNFPVVFCSLVDTFKY